MKNIRVSLITIIAILILGSCGKSGPSTPAPIGPTATTPVLGVTTTIGTITSTSAASGGNVTSDGGATVTARGICWSTSSNPTTANSKTTDGSGTGIFASSITGLTANTVYYVRAYAINSVGTAYASELSFTTSLPLVIPTLAATTAASAITANTAISGGNVISDGGASITSRGVCWSTSSNPTTTNSKTTDGSGTGIFASSITGLTANTVYYVRAYAINSVGTSYGPEISFTSFQAIGSDFQGGKLAYILTSVDPGYNPLTTHGLIAAPTDITSSIWSENGFVVTGATGTAIGTGNANTNQIVLVYGPGSTGNYTAKRCYDLVLNGYSDWYLPGKDEMNKLYLNKAAIGGFSSTMYWTSSEVDVQNVWVQTISDGFQFHYSKSSIAQSRPVRSF